jgi:hypothetical protein
MYWNVSGHMSMSLSRHKRIWSSSTPHTSLVDHTSLHFDHKKIKQNYIICELSLLVIFLALRVFSGFSGFSPSKKYSIQPGPTLLGF